MKKEYTGKKSNRSTGAKNVSRSGSRPGSSRPGSSRPGSSRPGSGRPGSGRPGSSRPGSSRPGSSRPSLGRPVRRSEESSDHREEAPFRRESRPGTGRPGTSRPGSSRPGTSRPGSSRPSLGRPVRRSEESSDHREEAPFRRESRPMGTGRPGTGRPGSSRPGTGRPGSSRPSLGRPVRRSEESSDHREEAPFRRESRPMGTGRPGSSRPGTGRPGAGRPSSGRPSLGRPVRKSEEASDHREEAPFRRESRQMGTSRPGSGRPGTGRPGSSRPGTSRPGSGRPSSGRPSLGRPVRKSEEASDYGDDAPVRRPVRPAGTDRPGTGKPRRDSGKPLVVRPVRKSEEASEDGANTPIRRERNGGRAMRASSREPEQQDGMRPVRRRPEPGATGKPRTERGAGREEQPERLEKRSSGRTKAKPKSARDSAPDVDEGVEVRLNKFLADAGIASRRKADALIQGGVVKVNQEVVTEPGTRVHPSDLITVRGEPVSSEKHLTYILLNKPKGYITTTSDEKGRKTVMDIVRSRERIFPVGRLDRNTSGVLLFTNDGEMANHLMHPRYEVPRVYNVTLNKYLLMEDARKIAAGVELEDGMTQPCSIIIDPQKKNKVTLEITEGKNREVRRIFESMGYDVEKLDRKIYAGLTTRGMKRGEFRHLTRQEVRELEELLSLQNRSTSTSQAGNWRRRTPGRGRKKSW